MPPITGILFRHEVAEPGRQPGDHPCRRYLADGFGRQPDPRRHGRSVVRASWPWPQGDCGCGLQADERAVLLQHVLQDDPSAAIALSEKLAKLAPDHINRVFYCSSGSEANDTVFRMVRTYWDKMGKPDKKVIIGRWNGYHGSTLAGTSLGGMKGMHQQGGLPVPGVHHIDQPYWFGEGHEMSRKSSASLPRANWKKPLTRSVRTRLRPSSPNRSRALVVSSFRRRPIGRKSAVFSTKGTSSSFPTRSSAASAVSANGSVRPTTHEAGPDAHRQGPDVRLSADGRCHGFRSRGRRPDAFG